MTTHYPYFELTICNVTEPDAATPWRHHAEYKTDNVNGLRIPTLAKAHAVASLCGITHYVVKCVDAEDIWGKPVFESERIKEIDAEEATRKGADLAYRFALAEAINKEATTRLSKLMFGITLELSRSEATFDPKVSHRLLFDVNAKMIFKNREGKVCHEDPSDYQMHPRSGGYKLRTKEFIETMCKRGYLDTITAQEAKDILNTAILRRSAWRNELLALVSAPKED